MSKYVVNIYTVNERL